MLKSYLCLTFQTVYLCLTVQNLISQIFLFWKNLWIYYMACDVFILLLWQKFPKVCIYRTIKVSIFIWKMSPLYLLFMEMSMIIVGK